jgi:peptide subunit release factor 1 (eRF1)
MTDLAAELHRLARLPESELPFLSVYLDTQWDDEQQRERVRLFVRNRLRQGRLLFAAGSPEAESFARDEERIQDYVVKLTRQAVDVSANGVALFACHAQEEFTLLTTPRPFEENLLVVRSQPYLLPLVRISEEYEQALLCLLDSRSARIIDVVLGGVARQAAIESGETPKRHSQGGWSQTRYQRHVEDRIDAYHREVAEVLVKLSDENPEAHLFLGGAEVTVAHFRTHLPARIQKRVADVLSLDLGADDRVVLRVLLEGLEMVERSKERALLRETIEAALAGGLGVLGLAETLEAVNRGAVRVLVLDRSFAEPGWRCSQCGALGAGTTLGCPYCQGTVATCDLAERMVEKVVASGGSVDTMDAVSELDDVGGVAAALRFR